MNIIIGMLSALLSALGGSYWKKSIDNTTLSNPMFVFLTPLIGFFLIYLLVLINGINSNIFNEYFFIFLLFLGGIFDGFGSLLETNITKKVKISKILPYSNFDSLFIILLGFIIFYGEPGYESKITFLVSIIAVILVMIFSIDFKKLGIDANIKLYILVKFLYACTTLMIGKILFEYSTLDVFAILIIFYFIFHLIAVLYSKSSFTLLLKQNKSFYKYRLSTSILGRSSFLLSIYIIDTSGVLIAALLGFLSIVFSVFSMKYILGDNPTKKQILLAFLVICLIGIGYYFK